MFDPDFYPTPLRVIEEMLYGEPIEDKIILEPSAGKGDIVDFLVENNAKNVIACEKHNDLRKIVATKCKVIADDFLTVKSEDVSHVDYIVMNPPFSGDEMHIIHAFNIATAGCRIIALCNIDTYRKGYSQTRKEFKTIVDENGSIKNLGSCFDTAERKTYTNIGLIKITKPGNANDEFEGFFMEEEIEEESNGIMPYNFVRDLVNRYVAAVKLFDEQIELGVKMNDLTNSFFTSKLSFTCNANEKPVKRSEFRKDLQKSAWNWVFNKMNMQKYITKGLKEEINRFVERQSEVPFTMRNIYKMVQIVAGTHKGRMDKAIIEVFDKLTTYYHDNRYNVEGWKTNSHYLMGEKFILPYIAGIGWHGEINIKDYGNSNFEILEDFIKALCYITATNYDEIPRLRCHVQDEKVEWGKWFSYAFFDIRFYKKGTAHFKFKDRDVWAMLNQHIARIKGYPLPEGIKKQTKQAA